MGKKNKGRQGYKAARGKGKGSLVHAAKLARKRNNERQQENSKKRKLQRVQLEAKKERRRKNAFVPYNAKDTILLIGEGNFSFARALVRRFEGLATRVIATSYDTREEVISKYPEYPTVQEELEAAGVSVVHGVNCTALESNTNLRVAIETMQAACGVKTDTLDTGIAVFDKIVFNFPHTACGIRDTLENNKIHQKFMSAFFHSATQLLRPTSIQYKKHSDEIDTSGGDSSSSSSSNSSSSNSSTGASKTGTGSSGNAKRGQNAIQSRAHQFGLSQIHVTLKTGEPYASWQIPRMAKLTGMLRLQTAIDFYPDMYLGYEHRRTLGGFRGGKGAAVAKVAKVAKEGVARETQASTTATATEVAAGGYPGPDWSKAVVHVAKKKPRPNKTLEANNDVVGARTYIFIKGTQAMKDEKEEMMRRVEDKKREEQLNSGQVEEVVEEDAVDNFEFSVKIGGNHVSINIAE
jgi:25S rRNA (uracil2634-N3)-methyltransferase